MADGWDPDAKELIPFGNWFAGFCDGEASFLINKTAYGFRLSLEIELREDDIGALKIIQGYLGGTLIARASRQMAYNGIPTVRWAAGDKESMQRTIDILDRCPMRAKKKHCFEVWRKAFVAWTTLPTPERWDVMRGLKTELQDGRKYVNPRPEAAA